MRRADIEDPSRCRAGVDKTQQGLLSDLYLHPSLDGDGGSTGSGSRLMSTQSAPDAAWALPAAAALHEVLQDFIDHLDMQRSAAPKGSAAKHTF